MKSLLIVAAHLLLFSAVRAERPNIVLILGDDIGYECLEAYGGTSYKTPHLNALARSGLKFNHCHSQPLCTPTRVQIMTGLYNQRNYIRFGILDPQATTFAHILKDAGYKTCIAGKWQLEGGFEGPRKFGFDEYCLWQLTRRPARYPNPGLEINGKEVDFTNGEYGPDLVSDFLCDFIERNKEGPFFAYYPMILPHSPFVPTPDSREWDPTVMGRERGQGKNKFFADMVAYTDKMVGKVVAKLEELGIRDNTLVIFTGDNGTNQKIASRMGDAVVPGGKGKTTDNGTHVALVASWPQVIEPGRESDDLIDFTDVLPTLTEVGEARLPAGIPFDGVSFAPQLRGETGTARDWIYCWYQRDGKRDKASRHARDRQYKLYATGEMYDVDADPQEKSPLDPQSGDSPVAERRAALQAVLDRMKVDSDPQ
jgi:arylsulfatase A